MPRPPITGEERRQSEMKWQRIANELAAYIVLDGDMGETPLSHEANTEIAAAAMALDVDHPVIRKAEKN